MKRKPIIILGGGLGSLTTAAALTDPKNPRRIDGKDITVYQIGWRLGGKGSSGVNVGADGSVEEHGLHIWFGFYENAFRLIRAVMAAWNPGPAHPWGADGPDNVWTHAFKPHSFSALAEHWHNAWHLWEVNLPPLNNGTPGDGQPMPLLDVWRYLAGLEQYLNKWTGSTDLPEEHVAKLHGLTQEAHRIFGSSASRKNGCLDFLFLGWNWFRQRKLRRTIATLLNGFLTSPGFRLHQMIISLDLAWAVFWVLRKNASTLTKNGLDALDGTELRTLLRKHGASDAAVNSPILSSIYDAVFAQTGGDPNQEDIAGGTGLRILLRLFFDYKGAFAWKMQAGMGDTIFVPVYEVLKARGVDFQFFHRVKEVVLAPGGKSVSAVKLGRQVTLTHAGYDPLLANVRGMSCWPNQPVWDQIAESAQIQAGGFNLEQAGSGWQDAEDITLHAGADFDRVVLGISLAALPGICPGLMQQTKFKTMTEKVKTVRTQAWQVWMQPDLAGLGWNHPPPIFGNFLDPLNTWADMSQILPRENHPAGTVGSLHYFCGPLSDEVSPADAPAEIRKCADATGDAMAADFWPGVRNSSGGLDRTKVVQEYFRTNTDPTERYVLSVTGSTAFRLWPGETGCTNLTFTGDWTRNGINAGCVEATVMSGLLACQHITQWPASDDIPGIYKGPVP